MQPVERYRGALLGLACGDAVGATVQFNMPGSFEPMTDMVGGGSFHLEPGQWTDDTAMALCLADSLIESRGFDPRDQMERYLKWLEEGYLSSRLYAFDVGGTVSYSLRLFADTAEPFAGPEDPLRAGNGSIMRLAPVPLFFARSPHQALEMSRESSRTTHGALTCLDGCRYLGALLVGALSGLGKEELLAERYTPSPGYWEADPLCPEIDAIARGSFKEKQPPEIRGTGYVVDCLEAALWAFFSTDSFKEGCLAAVNLGDDADTTAAVYGQLAGAFYGEAGIPASWHAKLSRRPQIEMMAERLFVLSRRTGVC